MQIYPEKYDKLELLSSERSFVRTIDRAYCENELGYFVLHINPRKREASKGTPELFDMLLCDKGILFFRFFESENAKVAVSAIRALSNSIVFMTLRRDICHKLEESRYLVDDAGRIKYSINICLVFPNIDFNCIRGELNGQEANFCDSQCLFSDGIAKLRKQGEDTLADYFDVSETLTEESVNYIFQRVCPEITIPRKYILNDDLKIDYIDSDLTGIEY